jgi:hypothetical protein
MSQKNLQKTNKKNIPFSKFFANYIIESESIPEIHVKVIAD